MVTNQPPQMKNCRNIIVQRRNLVSLVTWPFLKHHRGRTRFPWRSLPPNAPQAALQIERGARIAHFALWILQAQPDRPRPRAGDRLGDEAQAAQALLYPGVISHRRLTHSDSAHVLHEATVDVRKSLEIALRMPGRHSSHSFGRRA